MLSLLYIMPPSRIGAWRFFTHLFLILLFVISFEHWPDQFEYLYPSSWHSHFDSLLFQDGIPALHFLYSRSCLAVLNGPDNRVRKYGLNEESHIPSISVRSLQPEQCYMESRQRIGSRGYCITKEINSHYRLLQRSSGFGCGRK